MSSYYWTVEKSEDVLHFLLLCYSHVVKYRYADAAEPWTVSGKFPNCSRRICEINAFTMITGQYTAQHLRPCYNTANTNTT